MENLYIWPSARARHLAAPLLKERNDFLAHLLSQGCSHARVRNVAGFLLRIIQFMEMSRVEQTAPSRIQIAADRWAVDTKRHQHRKPGPSSAKTFVYVAQRWLRFHGALIEPSPEITLNESFVRQFAVAMRDQRGLSKPTVVGYGSRALLFLNWCQNTRRTELGDLGLTDVDAYLDEKRGLGWKPRSIATQCQALRTFLRYAELRSWCKADLAKGIKSPCLVKYGLPPQGPAWKDVTRLLNLPSLTPEDIRANAAIALFSIYGLRSSEVADMKLSDFDWRNETFVVRHSKRGRTQQYPIQYAVGEAIIKYLRDARPHSPCRNVFLSRLPPYRPVASSGMWQIVSRRMRSLDIKSEHVGPHALRHSCATQLLKKGSSLKEIADFLGHQGLKSVGIYAKYDVRSLKQVASFSLAGVK